MDRSSAWTHVIWLQTGFIGDIVLTTGASELLAQEMPKVRQIAVTTPQGKSVFEGTSAISHQIVFRKRSGFFSFKPFQEIKSYLYDLGVRRENSLLIQVHRSIRSSILASYLRIPTITYYETPFRIHARVKVPRVAVFHEMARIAMLLQPLGIDRSKILNVRPKLLPLEIGETPDLQFMKTDGEFIGVAPGSVWGTKRWPQQSFSALIEKLLSLKSHYKVVLIGSNNEASIAEEIIARMPFFRDRIVNLVGRTTLQDLRRIMPRLKLLVANDSSPIHFASAFSVATVAVFGATIPEMGFGPVAPFSTAIGVNLNCRPCSDHGPKECPLGHFRCMRTLTVDSVFESCQNILKVMDE